MQLLFLVFLPMIMSLICYMIGKKNKKLRNIAYCTTTIIVFGISICTFISNTAFSIEEFCGLGLHFHADGFRSLYGMIAAFMWMMTGLFSPEYFRHYHNRNRYYFFNLMTLGATQGVLLSSDLYTTFVFFEIMSLTSYTWVAHEENPKAMKAAGTYLAVAVIGGLTTLMGIFMLWHSFGTLDFTELHVITSDLAAFCAGNGTELTAVSNTLSAASWLTLFGFAAKAGMFPLHIWLPKAHPVAPAPASALLSGILTKSGVFGVIVICADLQNAFPVFGKILFVLACVTMFVGALLALFSIDLKKTLACSSMSQIGFITVGLSMMTLCGEEGGMAASGALLHMVNHSLIKLCLFMCAGVIYMNLHKLDLNDIRGYGRKKPLLHIAFLLGALAIACIPPFGSGYHSKSLIHEGILEFIELQKQAGAIWIPYKAAEILFLISGGLTIAYMAKLYICIFWEKNSNKTLQAQYNKKTAYMNPLSAFAILVTAFIFPLISLTPDQFLTPLIERSIDFFRQEMPHHIEYYSLENLIGAAESIAIGSLVYLFVVRKLLIRKQNRGTVYVDLWPKRLDLEEAFYRPLVTKFLPGLFGALSSFIAFIPEKIVPVLKNVALFLSRLIGEGPEWIVLLLRQTVMKKRHTQERVPVGNRFTYKTGLLLDKLFAFFNKTIGKNHPLRTDMEYLTSEKYERFRQTETRISRSMSYGLILMAIGLLVTCLYLLLT